MLWVMKFPFEGLSDSDPQPVQEAEDTGGNRNIPKPTPLHPVAHHRLVRLRSSAPTPCAWRLGTGFMGKKLRRNCCDLGPVRGGAGGAHAVVRVSVVQAVAQWEELAVLGAPPGPVMNRRGTAKSNSLEA